MITVILTVLIYAFIGSIVGGRHHAIVSKDCKWKNGGEDSYGRWCTCFNPTWCPHVPLSIFFYGVFWWLALPVTAGLLIGTANKDTRIERRHAREIAEAKHKAELARLAREENEELDRQLQAVRKP